MQTSSYFLQNLVLEENIIAKYEVYLVSYKMSRLFQKCIQE